MMENNSPDSQAMVMQSAVPQVSSALAAVESSRAVAEVQASLVIAKANPRDEQRAEYQIMNSCKRVSLAKTAMYLYRRGGTSVTGPTIRLAEMIAGHWGNINYGFRELDRGKDYSEVEAFAHDLQSNTRVTRQFRVQHTRDKTSGSVALTQERDKYEMVASMAQRRVRACLIGVIPADIFEMASDACDATLNGSIGDIGEAVTGILKAFDSLGVTKEDIEGYLQRKMESLVPADIVNLRKIHTSIKNGIAPKEEFFREDDVQKLNERFSGNGKGKTGSGRAKSNTTTKPKSTKKSATPKKDDARPADVDGQSDAPNGSKSGSGESDPGTDRQDAGSKTNGVENPKTITPAKQEDGPAPGKMVACPEAGGMMIDSIDCPDAECFDGCKAFKNLD